MTQKSRSNRVTPTTILIGYWAVTTATKPVQQSYPHNRGWLRACPSWPRKAGPTELPPQHGPGGPLYDLRCPKAGPTELPPQQVLPLPLLSLPLLSRSNRVTPTTHICRGIASLLWFAPYPILGHSPCLPGFAVRRSLGVIAGLEVDAQEKGQSP
jgi:hypothetical protein